MVNTLLVILEPKKIGGFKFRKFAPRKRTFFSRRNEMLDHLDKHDLIETLVSNWV